MVFSSTCLINCSRLVSGSVSILLKSIFLPWSNTFCLFIVSPSPPPPLPPKRLPPSLKLSMETGWLNESLNSWRVYGLVDWLAEGLTDPLKVGWLMSECWLLKLGWRNNLLQEDHESWIDDKDTAVIKYRIPIQLRVFLPGVSNSDCLDYRHEFGVCGGVGGWGGCVSGRKQ